MDPVTVYQTFSPADAQLARARLEAAGFHPYVTDELASLSIEGYALAAGGIRVQVPAGEAEDARLLLQSNDPPGGGSGQES
jgi:hypothetical protein